MADVQQTGAKRSTALLGDGLNASFVLQATLNGTADAGYVFTCMLASKTRSLKQVSVAVWGRAELEPALSIGQK